LLQRGRNQLTQAALFRLEASLPRVRHSEGIGSSLRRRTATLPTDGASLAIWLAQARAAPLCTVAQTVVGDDLGEAVACFLDTLSDRSRAAAELDIAKDAPYGFHVCGRRALTRNVMRGNGRAGFEVRDDVSISTPGRSQSAAPRHSAVEVVHSPPLIFG